MITSKVIAHRFGCSLGPENTKSTLEKAAALGVKWVEFDASLLKDGNVVIFHDEVLDRCSNANGPLFDHSLEDLKTFDMGSWFDPAFEGERILSLKEGLRHLQDHNMKINLEIKVNGDETIALVEKVVEIVKQHWQHNDRLLFSSFSHDALCHLRRLMPQAHIGHLFEGMPEDWLNLAKKVKARTIHADADLITETEIKNILENGYPLYLYTVNDMENAQALFDQGVSAIFTDVPQNCPENWL